jgi:5-methylcytosine-specific restriction endonuclease McrA
MGIVQLGLFDGKACRKCERWQPLEMFDKNAGMRDGRINMCKECTKAYRASRGSKAYEQAKQWRIDNPERFRTSRQEAYRRKHPLKPKRINQLLTAEQREQRRERVREWNRRHPEKRRAVMQAYRARRKQSSGVVTSAEWKALCEYYDNQCLCCGSSGSLTMDHVIPLSKGGLHILDNVQPLCGECNSRKKDRTVDYRPSSQTRDLVIE